MKFIHFIQTSIFEFSHRSQKTKNKTMVVVFFYDNADLVANTHLAA